MAFIEGIAFLCLSILLLFLYALAGYYLVLLLQGVIRGRWKTRSSDEVVEKRFLPFWSRRFAKHALLVVISFHVVLYGYHRYEWMGSDNAHYKAKEYWVAGMPLYTVRIASASVLHPDIPVFWPMHQLQQIIYDRGVRHLPQNDGEIGVWTDMWLCYPYLKKTRVTFGTSKLEPSLAMRQLLDKVWFSIDAMGGNPMADRQMKRQQYARNLPRSMFYYILYRGYYADKMIGSASQTLQNPTQLKRLRAMAQYQQDLRDFWVQEGLETHILQTMPQVEVTRLAVANFVYGDLIRASIYPGQFTCDNPDIPRYLEVRNAFAGESPAGEAWRMLHKRQKKQAETFFMGVIDSVSAGFMKYLLIEKCGLEVPVEERYYRYRDKAFHKKYRERDIKNLYQTELKLLKEGKDE